MTRKSVALVLVSLAMTAASCKKAVPPPPAQSASSLVAPPAQESGRLVAVRHTLVLKAPEADLPKAWESTLEFCRSIRCEVDASSISNNRRGSASSASMSLRVVPDDLKKLFDHLGKAGSILEHTTGTEDKTSDVIDVEVQIKNLTEFRDRLRTLLGRPSASLKDLVEVDRELTKTQSELDSITTKRKVLANETEKVAVEITFRPEESIAGAGAFAAVGEAVREAGSVLSESFATLITALVAVIPWLLVIIPAVRFGPRLLRKLFRKRTATS
jgi:hypothetical protein